MKKTEKRRKALAEKDSKSINSALSRLGFGRHQIYVFCVTGVVTEWKWPYLSTDSSAAEHLEPFPLPNRPAWRGYFPRDNPWKCYNSLSGRYLPWTIAYAKQYTAAVFLAKVHTHTSICHSNRVLRHCYLISISWTTLALTMLFISMLFGILTPCTGKVCHTSIRSLAFISLRIVGRSGTAEPLLLLELKALDNHLFLGLISLFAALYTLFLPIKDVISGWICLALVQTLAIQLNMSYYRRRTSPRRSRSLSYKKKAIKSVHTIGLSKTLRKLNVTKDQIKSWLTKEEEIMQNSGEIAAPQSSKVLYAGLQQEEQVLLQWIMEKRRARERVYTDEVIEKAGRLFAQAGEEHKGKANRRWLGSFKKRFKLHGEVGDRPRPVQVLSAPKPLPVSAFQGNYQPLTPEISTQIDFFHKDPDPVIMDLEASPALEVIDLASTP